MEKTNFITQVHNVTPEEIYDWMNNDFIQNLKSQLQQNQTKGIEFLTRKEVAKLLKVSLVTLSEWNKKGILKPYRIGKLIRYKKPEIEEALIRIEK